MRETKVKKISGFDYHVVALGATEGRKWFLKLGQVMASGASAENPVAAVLSNITEDDLDKLCQTFAKLTSVAIDSKHSPFLSEIFDEWFSAKYGDMMSWLAFCLEVNYGSFLSGLGLSKDGVAARVQKLMTVNPLTSPTDVTGPSGS